MIPHLEKHYFNLFILNVMIEPLYVSLGKNREAPITYITRFMWLCGIEFQIKVSYHGFKGLNIMNPTIQNVSKHSNNFFLQLNLCWNMEDASIPLPL